jgi:Zn-dependent protease with chaperone function
VCSFSVVATLLFGAIDPPKPGWNLFSKEQDVQLGREAKAQIERQVPVVYNSEVTNYVRSIGERLARTRYSGQFPYSYGLVADKSINAFALPGGPLYVNTGLILAAENEAQLAGVIAHEMSHIALRHSTNQASKANLLQIPAMIAGGMMGGSLLGQLGQLGIGLGANSVLMKFSRSAETQADYNGALMMAEAGYNPIEMARFFEKLEATGGRQGPQFLSDHPNPGNRVKAVNDLVRQLPQRQYTTNTGQFERMQDLVNHLPNRGQLRGDYRDQHPQGTPDIRPSSRFRQYATNAYSIDYPDNWQAYGDQNSPAVTIAPRDALFQNPNGGVQIGYGATISYYFPQSNQLDLRRDTNDLVRQLQSQNSGMGVRDQRNISVDGQPGILTTLSSRSPYQGEQEIDALVTVARPEGLFYMVFIAPQSEWRDVERVFQQMLQSVNFRQ